MKATVTKGECELFDFMHETLLNLLPRALVACETEKVQNTVPILSRSSKDEWSLCF